MEWTCTQFRQQVRQGEYMSISGRIESLRRTHEELKHQIKGLELGPYVDNFEIKKLKWQKLRIKKEIERLKKQTEVAHA